MSVCGLVDFRLGYSRRLMSFLRRHRNQLYVDHTTRDERRPMDKSEIFLDAAIIGRSTQMNEINPPTTANGNAVARKPVKPIADHEPATFHSLPQAASVMTCVK